MARRRRTKLIGKLFLLFLFLLAIGAAGAFWLIQAPYSAFSSEVFVDIPYGASGTRIASLLTSAGVVRAPWAFQLARLFRPRARLQAGEYRFSQPSGPATVLDRIARGDIFFHEITIPEGSNMFDIGEILNQKGLMSAAEFIKAARDPSLIRDIAPSAPTLEGYLFPATYRVTRHTTPAHLCRDLTQRFRQAWRQLKAPNGGVALHRTVTLASLIEKETAVGAERPAVASVFVNRLDRGMKLDCDPTTIYAALLDGRYRGTVFRSDLESRNLYNTYQHQGLPPGPIANPGLKSLDAALHPAATAFLFFVAKADGSGGHVFSTNVDAHNKAVGEYRRGHQKGKAPAAAPAGTPGGKGNGTKPNGTRAGRSRPGRDRRSSLPTIARISGWSRNRSHVARLAS